jgi:CRISPR-associated protein Cas1
MTTLYVKEQGAIIRRTHQRLIVEKDNQVLESVRLRDLERVVLFGNVQLTAAAMIALLDAGIETTILGLSGKLRGRLAPMESKNIFLRQAQFRRYDEPDFRMSIARVILDTKIRNGRLLVQRHYRNHPSERLANAIAEMEQAQTKLPAQADIDAMMGVEGLAAKAYFAALGAMVRREFAFATRTRRPPRDPVNALLSFGYTLLLSELVGAVAALGMDPHVGYLHDLDYGRPSLALDLLEEFRQPVVDRLALSLVNRAVLRREHFEDRGDAGVLLNDQGRTIFLEFYHRALDTQFVDRPSATRVTFRALLSRQAQRMRQAIMGEASYQPYTYR